MNKKTMALIAFMLSSLGGHATEATVVCGQTSSSTPTNIVPAKQQKVIFGPYTSQCAGSHSFQVRGAPASPRIVIQQLVNGSWNSVTAMSYNPSGRFEAGTFRVILDNSHYNNIQTYAVNFSVPT